MGRGVRFFFSADLATLVTVLLLLCTALLAIPPAQFKLVLDAIIWALKHTMRQVADTGLSILYQLLQNVAQVDAAAQSFYHTYYIDILQHLFSVVTDSSHTAGSYYWLIISPTVTATV